MIQCGRGLVVSVGLFAAGLMMVCVQASQVFAEQPVVEKVVLADTIQPVSAGELDRAIARANTDGAQALQMLKPLRKRQFVRVCALSRLNKFLIKIFKAFIESGNGSWLIEQRS